MPLLLSLFRFALSTTSPAFGVLLVVWTLLHASRLLRPQTKNNVFALWRKNHDHRKPQDERIEAPSM
jgi:hypothetical protein